jgi:hypothetical protein
VEEDSGTFNRVTIGIRHRESARKYIKPLLVTKPESLYTCTWAPRGSIESEYLPPLFVRSRIIPHGKPKNSSYPVDAFVSFPDIIIRFLNSAVFKNKIVK